MRLLFLLVLVSSSLFADLDPKEEIRLRTLYASIGESFVQKIHFPAHKDPILGIVYGNGTYGYYETKNFTTSELDTVLELIPPGYRHPVDFYLRVGTLSKNHLVKVLTQQFKQNLPPIFKGAVGTVVSGKFLTNYFLLTGTLPARNIPTEKRVAQHIPRETGILYFYIVNRIGEIVWAHVPLNPERGLMKSLGDGNYILGLRTQIQYVDFRGHILKTVIPTPLKKPYILNMHHDFLSLADGKITSLIQKIAYASPLYEPYAPTEAYFGDAVITINPENRSAKPTWNSFKDINVLFPPPGSFQDRDVETGLLRFANVNSISPFGKKGYVLSLKNLNTILILNSERDRVVATVGPSEKDTYRPKTLRDRFYMQYHVTGTESGNLLFIDRGKRQSRIVEMALNDSDRSATTSKEYFPSPSLLARERGSAFETPKNNRVVGFFPSSAVFPNLLSRDWIDFIVEFDRETAKEKARMRFDLSGLNGESYRAMPLDSVGPEIFKGGTVNGL